MTPDEQASATHYAKAHATDPAALVAIRRVLNLSVDVSGCPGALADEVYAALVTEGLAVDPTTLIGQSVEQYDSYWCPYHQLTGDGCEGNPKGRSYIEPVVPVVVTVTKTIARATPKRPCPEGFHWIGQSFAWCDACGLPAWEHAGMSTLKGDAGPFGSEKWELKPWEPGEAEACRAKWEPRRRP